MLWNQSSLLTAAAQARSAHPLLPWCRVAPASPPARPESRPADPAVVSPPARPRSRRAAPAAAPLGVGGGASTCASVTPGSALASGASDDDAAAPSSSGSGAASGAGAPVSARGGGAPDVSLVRATTISPGRRATVSLSREAVIASLLADAIMTEHDIAELLAQAAAHAARACMQGCADQKDHRSGVHRMAHILIRSSGDHRLPALGLDADGG